MPACKWKWLVGLFFRKSNTGNGLFGQSHDQHRVWAKVMFRPEMLGICEFVWPPGIFLKWFVEWWHRRVIASGGGGGLPVDLRLCDVGVFDLWHDNSSPKFMFVGKVLWSFRFNLFEFDFLKVWRLRVANWKSYTWPSNRPWTETLQKLLVETV